VKIKYIGNLCNRFDTWKVPDWRLTTDHCPSSYVGRSNLIHGSTQIRYGYVGLHWFKRQTFQVFSYLKVEFVEVPQRVRRLNWASSSKLHLHEPFRPSYHNISFFINRIPGNLLYKSPLLNPSYRLNKYFQSVHSQPIVQPVQLMLPACTFSS